MDNSLKGVSKDGFHCISVEADMQQLQCEPVWPSRGGDNVAGKQDFSLNPL